MKLKFPLFISLLVLLFGCAQIVTPTGGDKDEAPPVILSEEPPNHTTGFTADQLIISFDEYIQLNSPSEQIVISPPMLRMPDYQLRKKSLVVSFKEELKLNTTYTINFGEAIKDNNEGNILKNYTYVFSTGPVLDSMAVKGKLSDALTGAAIEDVLIMLYKADVDSLPLDTIPDYFTRTEEDGSFEIEHVSDQPYRIFALKDQNSNYRFDIPDEEIGFLDSLILPTVESSSLAHDSVPIDSTNAVSVKMNGAESLFYDLQLFVEEDTVQFLKRAASEHYGKMVFVYNRPVKRFSAEIDGVSFKKQWALKEYGIGRDTIILWTTDVVPDTMLVLSKVDGSSVDTTEIVMKPRSAKITSGKKKKKKQKKNRGVCAYIENRSPERKAAQARCTTHTHLVASGA